MTQNILSDFEVQINHKIQVRRLDLILINKKINVHQNLLYIHTPLNESERRYKTGQIFGPCRRAEKVMITLLSPKLLRLNSLKSNCYELVNWCYGVVENKSSTDM